GALLSVPYAVGIGYAIGYGLGPRVADVQHALGGIAHVVLVLAITGVVVLVTSRITKRIVRLGVAQAIRARVRRRRDPSTRTVLLPPPSPANASSPSPGTSSWRW